MKTVLIIDDEEFVRNYLSKLVTHLGYTPLTAATASEGLAALAQPEPTLVIADVCLPDAPSTEKWFQQLVQTAAGRRIVLVSGDLSDELTECATACGITTFLGKPFEIAAIRDILAQTLDNTVSD